MNKKIFKSLLSFGVAAFLLAGCTEDVLKSDYDYTPNAAGVPAHVVSVAVTDTSVVEATVRGSVVATADAKDTTLLDWGYIYYTADMLAENKHHIASAKSTNKQFEFTVKLTGLVPNTNYFCKAYAINVDGISFGVERPFKTKPAKNLPYNLLASDPLAIWQATSFTHIDADGDARIWGLAYFDAPANTEVGLRSFSWFNAALKPENYVILPPVKLGTAAAKIDLDVQAFDGAYFGEKFKVVIATAPIITIAQAKAAPAIYEEKLTTAARATKTISIPAIYNDKVVWIGICHFETTDEYAIGVTNIKVY